jgi:DNA repair exonuclease SbcCD ATPase subunit
MNIATLSDEIRLLRQKKRTARYRTQEIRQREREYSRKHRKELKNKFLKLENRVKLLTEQLRAIQYRYNEIEKKKQDLKQKLNQTNTTQNLHSSLFQSDLEALATVANAVQEQIWESEIDELLLSPKLHWLIRFDLIEFQNLLSLVSPNLDFLTTKKGLNKNLNLVD